MAFFDPRRRLLSECGNSKVEVVLNLCMLKRLLLILLAVTASCWAQPTVTIGQIQWYTDYDEALVVARQQNKPLWLHFGENPG